MVTFLIMVTVLGIATIIGMMANDHPRNGGQSRDHLEDFDHFGEGGLPRVGDHHRILFVCLFGTK